MLTLAMLITSGAYTAYALGVIGWTAEESPMASVIVSTLCVGFGALVTAATLFVLRPVFQQKVLLLRAFRHDSDDLVVRPVLRAGFGRSYRLCGIRPPRVRTSWLTRAVLFGADGLRNLGSDRLDLEAGDRNWLARLLVTALEARLAAFDLRKRTGNLAREVQVVVTGVGLDRCLFFVGDDAARHDVASWVASLVPGVTAKAVLESTIATEGHSLATITKQVRARRDIESAARGRPDDAWRVVRSCVEDENLATPAMERDLPRTLVGLAVAATLQWLATVAFVACGVPATVPTLALTLVSYTLLALACRRLRAIGRATDPLSRSLGERWPTWPVTLVGNVFVLNGILAAASALLLPNVLGAKAAAEHTLTQVRLVQLRDFVQLYRRRSGRLPSTQELAAMVREQVDGGDTELRDSWGSPFRYESTERGFVLRSDGPDRTSGTVDDVIQESTFPSRRQ